MSLERTLHHFPLDPASRQVRLALGEKRLAFTEVQVRYWERPRALTALNASGLVPVLVETDGDKQLVLCEARAILDHLDETVPEPALLGRDPAAIRIGEVILAMEEDQSIVDCAALDCIYAPGCSLKSALDRASAAFMASLDGVTLADLLGAAGMRRQFKNIDIAVESLETASRP